MATLQLPKTPSAKIKIGDKVLCGMDVVDTSPIASRIAAFQKVHGQYSNADAAVRSAARNVEEQRHVIAAARVELNEAIEALARVLPVEGFDRRQPFQSFGAQAPGVLKRINVAKAVDEVLALEKAIQRHAGLTTKTNHAAEAMGNAARIVKEALGPLEMLEKTQLDASAKRDAFASSWDKAFSSLKRGAKNAEEDGHSGLFVALFDRPAQPKKKSAAGKNRPAPDKLDVAPVSVPATA